MDGFPRSANSYARFAFRHANPGVNLAGHAHSSQVLIRSAKRGLPTIAVIRDPVSCISSYAAWLGATRTSFLYIAYVRFHEALLPHLEKIQVATFEEVTEDMGSVILECNRRFGCQFTPYEKSESAEAAVRVALDDSARHHHGWIDPQKVARPSEDRSVLSVREQGGLGSSTAAQHRAVAIHERLTRELKV